MPRSRPAPERAVVPLAVRLAQSGILAAAIDVFTRKGVAATRVEDLLEAAGVARRTFYKYFGSKDEVLAGLYELATSELLRAIRAASDASGNPREGVRLGIDIYFDYHVGNAALIKLLIEQAIRSDSPLAPLRKRFRGELTDVLALARPAAPHETMTAKRIDPLMLTALISALEGVSLEVLENGARPDEIARAKTMMHALVARALAPAAKRR